jgi:transcriptional regulator with XRE-family HTH domain
MIRIGRPGKKERSGFGQRLAAARELAGVTQVELAQKLGVIQQVIAAWERRDSALKPEQIRSLAQALGTSTDHLLGMSELPKSGNGPSGKARQVFAKVSQLPRRQQQKIVEVVEALVDKAVVSH